MKNKTIHPNANAPKKHRGAPNATKCEAFLVSAFDLLSAAVPGLIKTKPQKMHRRMIGKVEVDVLLKTKNGNRFLIFCDGRRFHGGSNLNGGPAKIISDTNRRRALIRPGVTILNLREVPLPDLAVGENIPVADLCFPNSALLAALGGKIWGEDSAATRLLADPDFHRRVKHHSAEHWFPRLSRHVPEARRLKNLLSREELADLVARCEHPEAATILPDSGRGTKAELKWRCPKCSRVYLAKIMALLAKTETKGCPSCGGSKQVFFETSVAGTPALAADFLGVVGEPELDAAEVAARSGRKMKWRCKTPGCTRVCIDHPGNRANSTGYCIKCGRGHRNFHASWIDPRVLGRVRAVVNRLIDSDFRLVWSDVKAVLEPRDRAHVTEKKCNGPRLSKWGLKLIRRVQAERRQATQ